MSRVGELIFYWASMEIALADFLEANGRGKKRGGSLSERLDAWRSIVIGKNESDEQLVEQIIRQIEALTDIRNLIVHGLVGGSSMPRDQKPFISCRQGGFKSSENTEIKFTLSDIEHFIEATDACRRAMFDVSYFNYRLEERFFEIGSD